VSIEAAKWAWAFRELGFEVRTVAGEGHADRVLPGLAMSAPSPTPRAELDDALAGADLVVAENICSLPLNAAVTDAVAAALRGRPAVLRHHDLPWERPALGRLEPPPDDPAWQHVCITNVARRALADRGVEATTLYNRFEPGPLPGDREATRSLLGVGLGEILVLQPTRAIPRKNVPGGVALAEALGATYWLLGPAEDGYHGELGRVLRDARARVLHIGGVAIADAYAACDLVVLPSTWEGFGNPSVESAMHRRPLAIGAYPVAAELAAHGFRWFDAAVPEPVARYLAAPDVALVERNLDVARHHFSLADLPAQLAVLAEQAAPAAPAGRSRTEPPARPPAPQSVRTVKPASP
jgi:glycosyltransferase involved in cell wall biosynthesis